MPITGIVFWFIATVIIVASLIYGVPYILEGGWGGLGGFIVVVFGTIGGYLFALVALILAIISLVRYRRRHKKLLVPTLLLVLTSLIIIAPLVTLLVVTTI